MRFPRFNQPEGGAGGEAQGGGGGAGGATPSAQDPGAGAPRTGTGVPAAQLPAALAGGAKTDAAKTEAAKVEAAPVVDPVEALLAAEFPPDDPIWKGDHKIGKSYDEVLKHATPEVKALVANLRKLTTTKTTEAARLVSEAQAARAKDNAALATERARFEAMHTAEFKANLDRLKASAAEADPFTAEGQEAIAEAKAAALFEKMMAPEREAAKVAAEAAKLEAQKAQWAAFVAQNPDIKEPAVRARVAAILKAKPHFDLEEAYQWQRGETHTAEAQRLKAEANMTVEQRAKLLALTGGGGAGGGSTPAKPKFRNAVEAYEWHKARGAK